jgi:hypothetical protein
VQYGQFEFDAVHDGNSAQEDVYRTSFAPVVNAFLKVCCHPTLLLMAPCEEQDTSTFARHA